MLAVGSLGEGRSRVVVAEGCPPLPVPPSSWVCPQSLHAPQFHQLPPHPPAPSGRVPVARAASGPSVLDGWGSGLVRCQDRPILVLLASLSPSLLAWLLLLCICLFSLDEGVKEGAMTSQVSARLCRCGRSAFSWISRLSWIARCRSSSK